LNIVPSLLKTGLSSRWDGLNPNLIARFWEVDRKGKRIGFTTVSAPLTTAEMEISLSWQSAFENAGAESKAPALMAMLQSGALQPVMAALGLGGEDGKAQDKQGQSSGLAAKAQEFAKAAEGRTGITKLNSVQIFVGMTPVKFSVSALFRAWLDPASEVEAPFNQLMNWALPIELSEDGALVQGINAVKGNNTWLDVLMPSKAPTMIAMQYKGRTYSPLVIEGITDPLDSPIDGYGQFTQKLVPLQLSSLAAWDRKDWANTRKVSL